jgi:hypothetical protein
MDLQYISNESGEKTAVIIPIEEWKHITDKHQDLKDLENVISVKESIPKKRKPSDYAGIISKDEAERRQNYLKTARSEWDRDFL